MGAQAFFRSQSEVLAYEKHPFLTPWIWKRLRGMCWFGCDWGRRERNLIVKPGVGFFVMNAIERDRNDGMQVVSSAFIFIDRATVHNRYFRKPGWRSTRYSVPIKYPYISGRGRSLSIRRVSKQNIPKLNNCRWDIFEARTLYSHLECEAGC